MGILLYTCTSVTQCAVPFRLERGSGVEIDVFAKAIFLYCCSDRPSCPANTVPSGLGSLSNLSSNKEIQPNITCFTGYSVDESI